MIPFQPQKPNSLIFWPHIDEFLCQRIAFGYYLFEAAPKAIDLDGLRAAIAAAFFGVE